MPKHTQQIQAASQGAIETFYRGPVPPPAVLEHIDRIVPGAAERIIVMAEKEQDATHARYQSEHMLKAKAQNDEHRENMTSLWMAFCVCISFVSCGTILVLNGFEKIGGVLIGTTLLGVVASFLRRKRK